MFFLRYRVDKDVIDVYDREPVKVLLKYVIDERLECR